MDRCDKTRSAFKGIVYDDMDVHAVIQEDVERINAVARGNVVNQHTREFMKIPELFPHDHPLCPQKKCVYSHAMHATRWFLSPFDFHTNGEIDRITGIMWTQHNKTIPERSERSRQWATVFSQQQTVAHHARKKRCMTIDTSF